MKTLSIEGTAMDSLLPDLTPVEQASLLAVRLRALDARSATPILDDRVAERTADAAGLDLTRPTIPRSAVLVHAVRAKTLDDAVREFVARHPDAVVVDLGCGLDARRQRCAPGPGVDWYCVDLPAVIRLRAKVLPDDAHRVPADVTSPDWLQNLPRDRPTIAVTDGLMAFLAGDAFVELARAITNHFTGGEFTFNAYSRLAMRNSRRMGALGGRAVGASGSTRAPTLGDGIDDPREPEAWNARLALIEELSMARAPEVALFPPVWRTISRISARSARMIRAGDRVVRYRFPA
ncbi:MAG: class I SAM-dependent methyltransferase [Pseudonocardia sp.]|nr:class I SAM-dependent methyltransferase [Pseudonocardia sp.]